MKTPEQLAEEYANESGWLHGDYVWREAHGGFLAGYQAAQDQAKIEFAAKYDHKSPLQVIAAEYVKRRGTTGPLAFMEENRFIDGYEAGLHASKPQWISVKERLPESTPMVLAICSDGYELAYYGNYGKDQWTNTLGTENLNVTHWMLLPTPPKEEK